MVQRENCNTSGDKSYHELFVERKTLAEDCEMQEHYGKKFARFGEDESDIVDVGERCIAKRGCQR